MTIGTLGYMKLYEDSEGGSQGEDTAVSNHPQTPIMASFSPWVSLPSPSHQGAHGCAFSLPTARLLVLELGTTDPHVHGSTAYNCQVMKAT